MMNEAPPPHALTLNMAATGMGLLFSSGPAATRPQGFKGVSYEKAKGVWRSRLYCKGQHITLGRYPTPELAARAHDVAAFFVYGNSASVNFRVDPGTFISEFNFGRSAKTRLAELRQAVLWDQSRAQLPGEEETRAIRIAAADAAFRAAGLDQWRACMAAAAAAPVESAPAAAPADGCCPRSEQAWKALVLVAARSSPTTGRASSLAAANPS